MAKEDLKREKAKKKGVNEQGLIRKLIYSAFVGLLYYAPVFALYMLFHWIIGSFSQIWGDVDVMIYLLLYVWVLIGSYRVLFANN